MEVEPVGELLVALDLGDHPGHLEALPAPLPVPRPDQLDQLPEQEARVRLGGG